MCRGHHEMCLHLQAGWAICWGENPVAAGGTLWQKAASLGCLLCPQHSAGISKACSHARWDPFHWISGTYKPGTIKWDSMILTSPFQLEIFMIADTVVPDSIHRCCVGEKWVFSGQGCWPSWDLWFRAGWGVALWTDSGCPISSHTAPQTHHLLCLYCLWLLAPGSPSQLTLLWQNYLLFCLGD